LLPRSRSGSRASRWGVCALLVLLLSAPAGCGTPESQPGVIDPPVAIDAEFSSDVADAFEPDSEADPAGLAMGGPVVERRVEVADTDWLSPVGATAAGNVVRLAWTGEAGPAAVQVDLVLPSGEVVSVSGGDASGGAGDIMSIQDIPIPSSDGSAPALIRVTNLGPNTALYRAVLLQESTDL